jgi:hypothetical protein
MDALLADRKTLFRADAFRSFILITLAAGVLWAMHKAWIRKSWIALTLLSILTLFDLWIVDRRYIAPEDFIPEGQIENSFTPDLIDQEILKDPNPHFESMISPLTL